MPVLLGCHRSELALGPPSLLIYVMRSPRAHIWSCGEEGVDIGQHWLWTVPVGAGRMC